MNRPLRIAIAALLVLLLPGLAGASVKVPEPRAVAWGVLASSRDSSRSLTVHFIDVGQGDSILILSPERRAVLVDGGPRAGAAAILEVMRREGIESLDLVIATHPHLDHIGGIPAILEAVPVRFYMDPGYMHPSRAYENLLQLIEERRIPVLNARAGRRVNLGGGVVLEVLAPAEPLHQGTRSDANANSVIARVEFEAFSLLLTGDAEAETEAFLLSLPSIESTVLKVPHHGGRHSSTALFLGAIRPEVAVIQVSTTNTYGHPHPDTLARLEAVGAKVYRNDIHGTVTLVSDGRTYSITTERRARSDRAAASVRENEGETGRQRAPPARAPMSR